MGQNRRYDLVGRDIERSDRQRERIGSPIGLSIDEVRATGQRRDAREPIPVTARLQFQVALVEPREMDAVVIAWNGHRSPWPMAHAERSRAARVDLSRGGAAVLG